MTNEKMHTFEAHGLGKAPFECVDMDVGEHLTRCDFCGRAIRVYCTIRSADDRQFHVGHDCVNRTGDKGLIATATADRLKAVRKRVEARTTEAGRNAAVRAIFEKVVALANEAAFRTVPAPTWPEVPLRPVHEYTYDAALFDPFLHGLDVAEDDPRVLARAERERVADQERKATDLALVAAAHWLCPMVMSWLQDKDPGLAKRGAAIRAAIEDLNPPPATRPRLRRGGRGRR